ncbi:MAG: DnaJ C-terminal domain-containing protein [Ilumatobacteraceae bacterium]
MVAHPRFGRDGDHLTVRVPIRFDQAALGGEVEVPTLDGASVKLRLKPGTPRGHGTRCCGKGSSPRSTPAT